MFYLDLQTWIRLLVWLAVGLTIYFLYGRTHSVLEPSGKR
jgi:APA family basic amino acid/polyamine antiporter